ncbi:hypoxanthine phosphoribosyltransferase [Marinilabilia salmonicolor]|jgi:hypoxanthine phosphoribosyltransferase|uniref:Hypoxanthine phosphoribosyltransferase n=1 Tax=Marinilabilia salmonicolor TaxID=989 RepID=A0A2T0XQW5_9BACT|nr:hypoxanthine phosphoribosyltransferase [Marinilabilia salmonicolor]PRZ01348.1 hypoxanthine phosphoribosyltransferase [Marinilabilia salmonicolor]RCW39253.1 hypoxanthine phosphoribosyltransferase [Marinilabilia salmonicolor]
MKRIQLLDKQFALSIPASDIKKALWEMAEKMNKELKDQNPLMICILNGSFMFSADLMKLIDFPCEISFVKLASYEGMGSTGKVKQLIGLNEEIEGRTVVLLEDIVDTGVTIENLMNQLDSQKPKDVKVATLLFKPEACKKNVKLDYVGLEIPNDFIVGYGLDYDGYGRNLPDIYTVID